MKKVLWIQRLGFAAAFISYLRGVVSGSNIYYDGSRATKAAKLFLVLLSKLGQAGHFHRLRFQGDKKDSKGCTLFYKIYEDMEVFSDRFNKEYIPDEPDWFKNMVASYMLDWLSNPFYFMAMIEDDISKMPDAAHKVYISGYPIAGLVKKFTRGFGDGYVIAVNFDLRERITLFLTPFYLICRTLVFQAVRAQPKTDIKNIRPAVWVEYEGARTMLSFWHKAVKAEDFDLVYCVDRNDTPVTSEVLERARQDGFKWIDNRKICLAKFDLGDLKAIFASLFSYKRRDPAWLHFFRLSYVVVYRMYRSIFKKYKVKMLIQHHDTLWRSQAQVSALESAGGIMTGFHWSYLQVSQPFHLTPEHVYFVWGKHMYDYLERKGNTCRHILPCGLWIKQDAGNDPRKELSSKLDFVMAILDASVSPNIYHVPETLSQFYMTVLKLIEENKSWGGIVKCKYNRLDDIRYLPDGNAIVSRMKALIEDKRLTFVNYVASPITAAAGADLTVTYALQSAGIVAGTRGYPVVIWDVAGWLRESVYMDERQGILFPSLEDLQKAIIAFSRGDRSIGDFSDKRKRFDHFNDGKAEYRVGHFIQTFMEGVLSTSDADRSLSIAAQRYMDEEHIEDEFFGKNMYWNDKEPVHAS